MPRNTRTQTRVSVNGLQNIENKLQTLADWSVRDHERLVDIGERVADVYNNALRANVKDFRSDIKVQFKDRDDIIVKRGTLRRSIGTWQPDRNRILVMSGPRTNNVGRRKVGRRSDAFFAHIVEGGDSFGRKKTTPNTGVFKRSQRATQQRQRKLYVTLLKQRYERYMR